MESKPLDNIDMIHQLLEKLQEYVEILRTLKGVTAEELKKDIDKRAKAERYLQLAAQVCIDIADLIISDQRLPTPTTLKETIQILGEQNIINSQFAQEFSAVAGFRNILVHDYVKIDYEQVADKINNRLGDFDRFAKEVAQFLSSHNGKNNL